MNVTQLKVGNYFEDGGKLLMVMNVDLNKNAMRKMVVKLKVKDVRTGAITEMSANSGTQVETVSVYKKKYTYSYKDGNFFVFMDTETYEQVFVDEKRLEWEKNFLKDGLEVDLESYEGEILKVILPSKVELQITDCEPAVRGDTVNKATKDAIVETGWKIRVPLFVNNGDHVLVRTDNGDYDSRA